MKELVIPVAITLFMLSKKTVKYYAYELKDVHEHKFTPKFVNSSIYDPSINNRIVVTKTFYVFHKNYTPINQIKYKYPHESILVYLTQEQRNLINIKPKYDVII
jgi:hypothetical protein